MQRSEWREVDRRREAYIGFLQDLVRISQGGEVATQQRVAGRFGDLGCEVEVIRYDPRVLSLEHEFAALEAVDPAERVSVVGRRPGSGTGRSLLFFAHSDSEPLAGIEAWQHPPFAAELADGRLYGWGVADDLGGVAAMTCALDAVLAAGLVPRGDVILASTPSKRHARGIIAVLDRGYTADAAIYVHPAESGAGLKDIKAFTPGLLRFRITVSGRAPETQEPNHTAFYHLASDPIDKAWKVHRALQALNARRARDVHHPLLEQAVGRSTNLHVAYIHCGHPDQLSRMSPVCELAGAVVFPPGEKMADVQSQIARAVQAAAEEDDWLREHPPRLEWLAGMEGAEVSTAHPLYRAVSRVIRDVAGTENPAHPLHAASDIRMPILYRGIPTVGLGPLAGNLSQAGGHDEWVDVEDYIRTVKVLASMIVDWCGV